MLSTNPMPPISLPVQLCKIHPAKSATIEAAFRTLSNEFPALSGNFQALRDQRLALIQDTTAKSQGIVLGATVANNLLIARANDGSNAIADPYLGGTGIGEWRPTPSGFQPGLLPKWGEVKPFAIENGNQFHKAPPPSIGSAEYTNAYNEVKSMGAATGSARSQHDTETAQFWADGGGTSTPPGHWNRIAQTLANTKNLTVSETARMYALLNLAAADSAIACWEMKYSYSYWRPVTAIQNGATDSNPDTEGDPSWLPLLATPPFPGYVSGHSTFSAAASRILADFFGTDSVEFSSTAEGFGLPTRTFQSFSSAAQEAAVSRLYGGIHFRFDNEVGYQMGQEIGDYVSQRYLLAVPEPSLVYMLPLASGLALLARKRYKK